MAVVETVGVEAGDRGIPVDAGLRAGERLWAIGDVTGIWQLTAIRARISIDVFEITLQNGRVQQSNFHDYQMLRINQVPPIRVHLIKSGETPGGIGEASTTAAVPALRNAIYAATGVALRRMPVDRSLLTMAVHA